MPKRTFAGAKTYQSSVRIGNSATHSENTWQSHTKSQFGPESRAKSEPYRRVKRDPNASNVSLSSAGTTSRHFQSVTAGEFTQNQSSLSKSYRRARPAPGFDRQTANKTNYELGRTETTYDTANRRSTRHPSSMPEPKGPDHPNIGIRDYNPHNCAGYKHNLVTGKNDPYAPHRPLPARFKSNDKDIYGNLVGMGVTNRYYDLTVGRTRPKPKAPPTVKAREESMRPPLDSLMALRPPMDSDFEPRGRLSKTKK